MTGRKKDPLVKITEEEQKWLEQISRSQSEPASHVLRAKEIIAVAEGFISRTHISSMTYKFRIELCLMINSGLSDIYIDSRLSLSEFLISTI